MRRVCVTVFIGDEPMSTPTPAKESQADVLPLEERIRHRAYELYIERGNQSGSELDDWLRAEREILERKKAVPPRWVVRLKGDSFDLELLSEHFHPAEFSVTKEHSSFYVQSSEFELLSSEPEVRSKANEILESVNGIGRMFDTNFRPVEIDAITEVDATGSRKNYMQFFEILKLRDKAEVEVINAGGSIEPSSVTHRAESHLAIAQRDSKVAKTLRIFGSREHNWHNLNNILEVIESDVGQIAKAGWATQAEIDRFTRTANSAKALGDEARHGHDKFSAPQNPTTLGEAEELITRILKNWIGSK